MHLARPLAIGWLTIGISLAACSKETTPTAPSPVPVTTTPTVPTATPTSVPPTNTSGSLTFALPIAQGDSANVAFGIAPFGYHGADHAEDGHPGWDIEYRAGAFVRAAADGQVLSVVPDSFTPGRIVVQIEHHAGQHFYRTVYTNLQSVPEAVVTGAEINRGQVLGVAGSVSSIVGTTPVTYSMIHFQIDDFEYYAGSIPNPNAVSPENLLNAEGRALFNTLWPAAVFAHELTEPFATNPRSGTFPLTRAWRLESGSGPAGVSFTRRNARSGGEYEFAILAESGVAIESGNVTLRYATRPLQTMDLVSPTSTRLAIYDIIDDRMRLAIGAPGSPRPADLSNAAVYGTARPR